MEPSQNSLVKAVPQSPLCEQELSNLPDCVPLEIKSKSTEGCAAFNTQKTIAISISNPVHCFFFFCVCSLRPDLHGAGCGSCAAGEAAGAFSWCEGYRDRTSGGWLPILSGGSLSDAADVGWERLTCSWRGARGNVTPSPFGGAVRQTETDAPGSGSRGVGDKLWHSVILVMPAKSYKRLMRPSIVHFRVSLMDGFRVFECTGCYNQEVVSVSHIRQLDHRLYFSCQSIFGRTNKKPRSNFPETENWTLHWKNELCEKQNFAVC